MVELHLASNKIESINISLQKLTKLEILTLNENRLTIRNLNSLIYAPNLKSLDLSGNHLKNFPSSIYDLSNTLTELDMGKNSLREIPPEIIKFTLTKFTLSVNYLSQLPSINLKNLKFLDISFNLFEQNPIPIENLIHLQSLDISGNEFVNTFDKSSVLNGPQTYIEYPVPDKIIENLYIGSCRAAMNYSILQKLGIKKILIAAHELNPYFPESFEYVKYDINDEEGENLLPLFSKSAQWIGNNLSKNYPVLVHCKAGVSRSATLVISYLMSAKSYSFQEALSIAQTSRANILPNKGFIEVKTIISFTTNYFFLKKNPAIENLGNQSTIINKKKEVFSFFK